MSPLLPFGIGGDERVRTAGLLLARQALSQLSYTPTFTRFGVVVFALFSLFQDTLYPENRIVLMNALSSPNLSTLSADPVIRSAALWLSPLRFYTLERR